MAEMCRPSVALCDARLTEELQKAAIPDLRTATFGPGADLAGLSSGKPDDFADVDTAADDVALLAFTSGTTGRPKATMHFHRDVLAIADTFSAHVLRPEPDDVFTGSPPIGFTFGLGALVVFPLRAGASTLLLEKATPDLLAEAVARHGVTVLSTAPTAYKAILAAGLADRLAGVRRAVSAGETLPGAVWHAVHDATGLRIIDGIGATEMLHIFISAADDDIRPGATGRAVPGYTAEIHDDDGRPVPDGTPGHLAVRGPTGCRYLDGDRQEVYVRDGWNVTGDTYLRDADGYFVYQARTDDMIVSAGYNIAGPEVEQALLAHPDVVDCAVVGAPDAERGMIVKAFVVVRPERTGAVTAGELEDFVKQRIAPYKRPRAIEFCDELPRTSTGKLQRYRLR
jgi:2-aminobenzoate-CoA ligase